MDHTITKQNLVDVGCCENEIHIFMEALQNNNQKEELKFFSIQRKKLMDELHACQRKIECLDYLVYQIKRGEVESYGIEKSD